MHLMDFNTFSKLKARSDKFFGDDLLTAGLDPLIVPGLKAINKLPSVTTIFSCSGHPTIDDKGEYHSRMSVMFGVHDQAGMDLLYSLHQQLVKQLGEIHYTYAIKVGLTLMSKASIIEKGRGAIYPVVIIHVHTGTIEMYKDVHRIFNSVCETTTV